MRLLRSLFFCLAMVFLYSCGSDLSYQDQIKRYKRYVSKADSLVSAEDYASAIMYSDLAIEITDTLSLAFFEKGKACLKLNKYEEAEDNFNDVIEIEGKYSEAYKYRAKVYLKIDDSDFLDDIDLYIENYPNDEEAHKLRRNYYEEKNDLDMAIEGYTEAIQKNNQDLELYTKRSALFLKNGDYQEAIEDYNTILNLSPNNSSILSKKSDLEELMRNDKNQNSLILLFIGIYLLYLPLSIFVLKPLVFKRASKIGGVYEISRDPLIWALPVILSITVLVLIISDNLPTF